LNFTDSDGRTTFGADGAWVDLNNLHIAAGERLVFFWKFISRPQGNFNDFAWFLAFPDGDLSKPPLHPVGVPLAQMSSSATNTLRNTNWNASTWQPPTGFTGTVRWLVSNGERRKTRPGRQARRRFSNPSSLLLDAITIC
jgi:hypothetical protein